ncbi:GGDEF domain-containing protein [Actinoplanes sp. TFC3]|uniref:GGDEF domain-containing protein n=1 Tax=Actinoplanes sp. TFC3 TaxID=1710355 RepID=UPI001F3BF3E5|nr:GGDEF domain-containing protein [Actinoplanes sp. TFC3]
MRSALTHARLAGLIVAFAAIGFAVNLVTPVVPSLLLWLPTAASGVVLTLALVHTARSGALAKPTRQFWLRLSVGAAGATFGLMTQGYDVWRHPDVPGSHVTPLMVVGAGLAQLFIVFAMLGLPTSDGRPGDTLRLLLDAGTVMLAVGVFLWHFQTRHLLDGGGSGLIGSLLLTATGVVAVFAVMKVIVVGDRYVDRKALRLLAFGVLVGTLAPSVQPYLQTGHPGVFATMVGNPACFFVATLAAQQQYRAGRSGLRAGEPRRPFSVLPYAAVVAVQGLLLWSAFHSGLSDDLLVVVVAVLVTVLVTARQVTALIENGRLVHRLDHSASHDPLTGLANRSLMQRRLTELLQEQCELPVAIALLDLDGFKQVNDTLGHGTGDRLLVAVARRLAESVREGDVVARLGGDEFVVIMADATADTADAVVRRMIDVLTEPVQVGEHTLPLGASIGIAAAGNGIDAGELLRLADIAMYAAKELPGSAHVHYRDDLDSSRTVPVPA